MAARDAGASSITPLNLPAPYSVRVSNSNAGIVQGNGADWFGPLNPMNPTAPPEVRGRVFDFNVGFNLNQQPRAYEPISFADLRALAESYDLLRIIIETRKDQVSRMKWSIAEKQEPGQKISKKKPGEAPAKNPRIKELEDFFKKPDGQYRWTEWLRAILEDLFVIDAPTLLKMRNRGGQLIQLRQLDGASIKRVIDDWGRTPMPFVGADGVAYNPPAYQQVLKGMPAVDYSARDILYAPRNFRAHKVYGLSPVEQILMTVNIALRRQTYQLSYYTEGNVPESLIGAPDSWNPDQIKAFQLYWDDMLSGNLAARRRAKFIPGGVAKTFINTTEPDLTGKTDEWLARVVCYCFSISPQAFVSMMNRATADTAHDTSLEEGLGPILQWIKDVIDEILETEFGVTDLEFKWKDDAEVDPVKQEQIITGYVKSAVISVDEAREKLGYEPSGSPGADTPMALTMTGFVPIDANTIDGKKAMLEAMPPPPAPVAAPGENAPPPGKKTPPAGKEVGKHAHAPFLAKKKRLLKPLNEERGKVQHHRTAMAGKIAEGLHKLGKHVAAQARLLLRTKLNKADKTPEQEAIDAKLAAEIAEQIDLSGIEFMIDATQDDLEAVAADSAKLVLAQIGATDNSGLVDQVNASAVNFAKERAAEMVGKSYDEDGNLVDAVRAEYRIDETTREMLQQTIADGLEENIGLDEIASNIEDSFGFSPERADLIARTEISRANSEGGLLAAKGARDELGLGIKKVWQLAPDYEGQDDDGVCEDNANDGAIDLDEDFSSGDSTVPAHPNCRCVVTFETEDGQETGDEEE